MNERRPKDENSLRSSLLKQIDRICDRFEGEWKSGQKPRIEEYLVQMEQTGRSTLLRSLISLDLEFRKRTGEMPTGDEYKSRFSEYTEVIDSVFGEATLGTSGSETEDWTGQYAEREKPHTLPTLPATMVGRYELREFLGQGTFGTVCLGHDVELDRPVAIKFLHSKRFSSKSVLESLRHEARILAGLQHPAIVVVHDVGHDEHGTCLVMQYIEGRSLRDWMRAEKLAPRQAAAGIARISEAVHHAHKQGLVHRDLKPSNILTDTKGCFYVADFGLAVHEDTQQSLRGEVSGTAPYMAPEQVRGETHRLDGRTDVWGLGVVLYELLTRRLPFRGCDRGKLFDEIRDRDPKPPRQIDDTIPNELERICLKCLSKRMTDRYPTAIDLANDLYRWEQVKESAESTDGEKGRAKVIPKGLRSFSSQDKDFFLDLLSGPRDRDGLPESIRFWKSRIEETDAGFSCGLIYGPSGCGKSSFVRAGLLPRLADHVIPVYVEAVPNATESRLLKELRKGYPQLPDDLNLVEAFASVRAGKTALPYRKVLVVLDQFEQWLHVHRAEENFTLVDALRQCDGQQLQCLIMVRDDFWLATGRFFQTLEVQLIEGKNIGVVDLFDPRHAKNVLTRFGQAFECLPDDTKELTVEQETFLNQAVSGLLQDGKVVPVRLSLFAEMIKTKEWSPATLAEVGGTEGLGVTFLEESFGSKTANPQHRLHEDAARAVLKELLPDHSADIKGRIRAHGELMEVSGYTNRPADFDDLLRILDTELRLITPTDLEGQQATHSDQPPTLPGERYYQLSHDYLVRSLGEWLTRKERETWQGRARLCLEERTVQWKATQDKRYLPSLSEYVRIRAGVPRKTLNADQREVIRAATRRYARIALLLAVLAPILGWVVREANGRIQGRRISEAILVAAPSDLRNLIDQELVPYRRWADPRLRTVASGKSADLDERLRASLALVPVDTGQIDFLRQRLLDCSFDFFPLICDGLAPYKAELLRELWETLHDAVQEPDARFRAGMALAAYAPQASQWSEADAHFLTEYLVESSPDYQRDLRTHLRPLRQKLLQPLQEVFNNEMLNETFRTAAATALADFAADLPELLAELASDAIPPQYGIVYSALTRQPNGKPWYQSRLADGGTVVLELSPHPITEGGSAPKTVEFLFRERAKERLLQILEVLPSKADARLDRMRLARRRAGAAITLIRLGAPEKALGIFSTHADREQATQFVHRLKDRGVSAVNLITCLKYAKDELSRYFLLLALGEFRFEDVPPSDRDSLKQMRLDWYQHDPDSGVHGASRWLLRYWGFAGELAAVDGASIRFDPSLKRTWFVQKAGDQLITLVVFQPGQFMMGSPETEQDHQRDETQRAIRITHPFAICDREVTRGQFERFKRETTRKQLAGIDQFAPTQNHAMVGVNWPNAVLYCCWLTEQAGMGPSDQCYRSDDGRTWDLWLRAFPTDNLVFDPERLGFRLPTEEEWEYACRSGTSAAYSYGADRRLLEKYAWFLDNSSDQGHIPGKLRPNPRGLFDMHGNAYEWCYNWYSPYAEERVLRGGGWSYYAKEVRSAYRHSDQPGKGASNYGFRVARTVAKAVQSERLP